jgi:predicted nucleic acid-binding protein
MIIYVESNFILELALEQEQYQSCEEILKICGSGKGSLVIPVFCIAESYHTVWRRSDKRIQLEKPLAEELKLLERTKSYQKDVNTLRKDATSILLKSGKEENQRLRQVLNEKLSKAELIPLEQAIITDATGLELQFDLKTSDAIVYASILQHLMKTGTDQKCFLNRDRDFTDPDILSQLRTYNCKILSSFDDGVNYIHHQIQSRSYT